VPQKARNVKDIVEPQLDPEDQPKDDAPDERGLVPIIAAECDGHVCAWSRIEQHLKVASHAMRGP